MAANLPSGGRAIAGRLRSVGRVLASGGRDSAPPAARSARTLHASAYDKNPDEDQALPAAVPDEVLKPQSDKYWGPNPATGVFGPADGNGGAAATSRLAASTGGESVLDKGAWFRPLEDVQKPPPS